MWWRTMMSGLPTIEFARLQPRAVRGQVYGRSSASSSVFFKCQDQITEHSHFFAFAYAPALTR